MERGIFQFGYKNLSIRIFFSFKYYKIPFLIYFLILIFFNILEENKNNRKNTYIYLK